MSEAEIFSLRNELTGLVISVVSVSFGMISAYIAGLWLFLREAPISLRLLAFGLLSFGLAFMGALTAGLNELLLGTNRAWATIVNPASGIANFGDVRPSWLYGLSLFEASACLGAASFGAIYIALAYLTFIYSWPGTTAGQVRVAH
ncbi:hypothetical protein DLM45_01880 [Hyphomicrobium methylovorum]|uniref:hypothetical protein n=1 Tax=Hyphomicrobium methylovorum TaxID=84 RepID=UPI0015E64DFA|nr:hypothetical protein [Hyphomicrobium methylovorum]MBA2124976.1 hypothetical protein [Hyphomicrobium methylovorum]